MESFDLDQCVATHGQTDIGLWFVALWSPQFNTAVGVVFGTVGEDRQSGDKTFVSHGSFVNPRLRRRGIRTRLNDVIFANLKVDMIRSACGSNEGGEAFMRRTGYQRWKDGSWYVRREAWNLMRSVAP